MKKIYNILKIEEFSEFTFFLFVTPAFKIYLMQQVEWVDNLFDVWGILAVGSMFIALVLNKIKLEREFIYMIGFLGVYLFSTLLNDSSQIIAAISEVSRIFIIPMYMLLCSQSSEIKLKKNLLRIRSICICVLTADALVTLIQILGVSIFESPILSLLGMDNYAAFTIIPMLTIIFFVSILNSGHISKIDMIIYFVVFLSKILTKSGMAMIALLILGCLIICNERDVKFVRYISPRNTLIGVVISLIGVVFLKIQYVLEPVLVILGKGVTLNSRTIIWDKTIDGLLKSPIIGYGKCTGDRFRSIVGFGTGWTEASHPHNFILSVLFATGIVGVFLYLKMFLGCFERIKDIKDRRAATILSIGLVSYLVLGFADDYILQPFNYVVLASIIVLAKDKKKREQKTIFK